MLALVLLVALHEVLQSLRSILKRQDMRNRAVFNLLQSFEVFLLQ